MAPSQLPAELACWVTQLASILHARLGWRLMPIMVDIVFAQRRQTVANWLRAAKLGKDFRGYYYFLGSLRRKAKSVATVFWRLLVARVGQGGAVPTPLDCELRASFSSSFLGTRVAEDLQYLPASRKPLGQIGRMHARRRRVHVGAGINQRPQDLRLTSLDGIL